MHALDATELAFFKAKFELLLSKVFETKYPALSARSMFPVSPEGGEGIDSVSYLLWDAKGIAQFISAYAGDIPRAEVSCRKITSPVHRMAESFGMTLDEIKKARLTNTPLDARKAKAVRDGHEEKLNEVAFYGNSALGLMGLFSHPNIPNGAAPVLDWDADGDLATPDEIFSCFSAGLEAVRSATSGREKINAIRLPGSTYADLALRKISTNDSTTVLTWLKTQLAALGVTEITEYPEGESVTMLAGEAVGARKVITYYNNSSDCLELFVPEDLNFLEPQKQGLEEITIGTMTTGGLVVYTPLAIYLQWISTPAG